MKPNIITFDESMSFEDIQEIRDRGDLITCPKCGEELIIALDTESMVKHGVHRGIVCSKNRNHFRMMVEVQRDPSFWDQFDD